MQGYEGLLRLWFLYVVIGAYIRQVHAYLSLSVYLAQEFLRFLCRSYFVWISLSPFISLGKARVAAKTSLNVYTLVGFISLLILILVKAMIVLPYSGFVSVC